MTWRPERLRVGTAGRPHGLHGAFHVNGACGWWAFPAGSVLIVAGAPHRVVASGGTLERPHLRLAGVDDRDAASTLTGAALELLRELVPEPEPDTYFRFDLVGCEVRAGERLLGCVAAVEDGVAHDVLVLDDTAETRIPFVAELVPEVDVTGRRLGVVDWIGT